MRRANRLFSPTHADWPKTTSLIRKPPSAGQPRIPPTRVSSGKMLKIGAFTISRASLLFGSALALSTV